MSTTQTIVNIAITSQELQFRSKTAYTRQNSSYHINIEKYRITRQLNTSYPQQNCPCDVTQVSYSHSAIHRRKYILRSDKDKKDFLIYSFIVPFKFRKLSLDVAEDLAVVLLKLNSLVQTKAFICKLQLLKKQ